MASFITINTPVWMVRPSAPLPRLSGLIARKTHFSFLFDVAEMVLRTSVLSPQIYVFAQDFSSRISRAIHCCVECSQIIVQLFIILIIFEFLNVLNKKIDLLNKHNLLKVLFFCKNRNNDWLNIYLKLCFQWKNSNIFAFQKYLLSWQLSKFKSNIIFSYVTILLWYIFCFEIFTFLLF